MTTCFSRSWFASRPAEVLLLEAGPAYRRAEYLEVMLDPERISGDQNTTGASGPR